MIKLTFFSHFHSFQPSLLIILGLSDACQQKPTEIRMVVGSVWNLLYIYTGKVCCILFRESDSQRPHWCGRSGICFLSRQDSSLTFYSKITHNYQLLKMLQPTSSSTFVLVASHFPTTSAVDFPQSEIEIE